MEYKFEYETGNGSFLFNVEAEVDFDEVGGCVSCGCKPCYRCSGTTVIDSVSFTRILKSGKKLSPSGKELDAIEKYFYKHHEDSVIEALNTEPDGPDYDPED